MWSELFRHAVPRVARSGSKSQGLLATPALFALVLACGPLPLAGASELLLLIPSADTALLESFPTNNFGGQTWLNAGTTQTYKRNRGLLKFDVAGQLPARARILAVTLTLQVTRSPVDGDTPSTFDLHRVLRAWGEGDKHGGPPLLGAPAAAGECTWTHRFALSPDLWAEPGGAPGIDYAPDSSADTFVYSEDFSPYAFTSTSNLVADVQLWQRHPELNFGWMLKTRSEAENFSARRFATREDPFLQPVLTLEYDLPQLQPLAVTNGVVALSFWLEEGEPCTVEHCDGLSPTVNWRVLADIPAASARTNVVIFDSVQAEPRFYRLRFR